MRLKKKRVYFVAFGTGDQFLTTQMWDKENACMCNNVGQILGCYLTTKKKKKDLLSHTLNSTHICAFPYFNILEHSLSCCGLNFGGCCQ